MDKMFIVLHGNPSQRCGASLVVQDHTVLPVTWHRWACFTLTPARQADTLFIYPTAIKVEFTWVDGYIPRWLTCHPSQYK